MLLCKLVIQPVSSLKSIKKLAEVILDFKEVGLAKERQGHFCLHLGVLSLRDIFELDGVFNGVVVPEGNFTGGTVKFLLCSVVDVPVDRWLSVGDI